MLLNPLFQGWVGFLSRQAKPYQIFYLFRSGLITRADREASSGKGAKQDRVYSSPNSTRHYGCPQGRLGRRDGKDPRRPLATISRSSIASAEVTVLRVSLPLTCARVTRV